MSRQRSVLQVLYDNFWNSLRRQPPLKPVGEDYLGNKYFEFQAGERSGRRSKRQVQPVSEEVDYELPFEWEAWLRGRRRDPPTAEEIQERIARQAQAVANAKRLEKDMGKEVIPASTDPHAFPKLGNYSSNPQIGSQPLRDKDENSSL
ncbi:NADH dehydrogenase [ubiquinone] 1 alpha subcomplex assembly factor 2 [Galendromus occidentalis]|uniref:NADH dehydrogenase [ubiquinone] 1 alpha subcomplex assembly factor 2 n=1 Tax=Galendromus occidentalis TaxID=34638 RepID=A0AAJ6QW64_9ACAR|nr:NADH dehydrogenase [ubiquinone] 1 alpha subcomplex assembly factor 2 [Galendromus occidentalis]